MRHQKSLENRVKGTVIIRTEANRAFSGRGAFVPSTNIHGAPWACRVPLSRASLNTSQGKSTKDPSSSSAGIPMGRQKQNRHSKKIIRWEAMCTRVMEQGGDLTERSLEQRPRAIRASQGDVQGRLSGQTQQPMGRLRGESGRGFPFAPVQVKTRTLPVISETLKNNHLQRCRNTKNRGRNTRNRV